MAIWLLKTEPSVYSFDDLARDKETMWDGVTQPHALINLRQMKRGDIAIIYHTGDERACIGIANVIRSAYINPEFDNPKLAVCDVEIGTRWHRPVTLAQIKSEPRLAGWDLIRLARLSVVGVSDEQMQVLAELNGSK